MAGKIYGIGVGIGDPEDITLKAIERIKESDILICPRKDLDKCRAYQTVARVFPGVERIKKVALEFEMTSDRKSREQNHRVIYEEVKSLVEEGKVVTFLTIGDPAIYSTYSYIADLAQKDGIETLAVSGVSSITACANALGIILCEGGEQLHVIPDTKALEASLKLPGTKVIMKCGRDMPLLKKILSVHRDESLVYAVSDCGTDREKCYRGLEELPDGGNYMLTVIVKERSCIYES